MNLTSLTESKLFKGIIAGIGFFVILLLVFEAGEIVGSREANFSYRWSENYQRNFAGGSAGNPDLGRGGFLMSGGIFGSVIKTASSSLIVQDRDDAEKVITISSGTVIRRFRDSISVGDLQENDPVVIIGSPNNSGQIEAKLIRVLPSPPPPSNIQ